ncbi:hypothetical protein BDQ17DRAFT_1351243 [Cyathus striatus]|nr:hypothetical protein BDQ17DRAFT_1351243 [Cyathus striatus]
MYSAQLLASFLNILPGLLNLHVLHLSKINLFQYQLTKKLAVISGRVQEIVVNACEFRSVSSENNTSGCEGIALPLKYIRVSDDGGAWVNPPGTYWWWSARHVPMPLHTLVLANVSAAKHMLGMPLPRPGDAVGWSTLWTSIAESCAGLEALRFINISKGKQYFNAMASTFYLPTDALAFLKLYEGPAEMTMPLIYERPVKHLVLYAVTDDKIALLAKALSIVQYADRMLSLHLDLDSVNDRVLEFISTFRNLQALSISVDSNIVCGYQPVDVVSTLLAQSPHTLSPHLEFFSLCALTRPTCEKPSPLQGFSDIRCPPYLRHCSRLRYVGFSEGETGASVHFSPWFGIWIEKQKTIEMWQNEVLDCMRR